MEERIFVLRRAMVSPTPVLTSLRELDERLMGLRGHARTLQQAAKGKMGYREFEAHWLVLEPQVRRIRDLTSPFLDHANSIRPEPVQDRHTLTRDHLGESVVERASNLGALCHIIERIHEFATNDDAHYRDAARNPLLEHSPSETIVAIADYTRVENAMMLVEALHFVCDMLEEAWDEASRGPAKAYFSIA
jgi:hypothetical protein